jgi:hypothetical protein
MAFDFDMPESDAFFKLSEKEKRILELVFEYWPLSALDLAQHFKEKTDSRTAKERLQPNTLITYKTN